MDFLSFPSEIRLEIYSMALTDRKPTILSATYKPKVQPSPEQYVGERLREGKSHLIDTALLRACRLVYQETIPILYGYHTFHYIAKQGRDFQDRFDAHLPLMQHLSFDYITTRVLITLTPAGCETSDLNAKVQHFLTSCACLQVFTLQIWVPLANGVSRFDHVSTPLAVSALHLLLNRCNFLLDRSFLGMVDLRDCVFEEDGAAYEAKISLEWRADQRRGSGIWRFVPGNPSRLA